MRKAAIVLGLFGGLWQLGVTSSLISLEPSSTPPLAPLGMAIIGVVGAAFTFKKIKLSGILMLASGVTSLWLIVSSGGQGILQINTETQLHGVTPGLVPVTLFLMGFGTILLYGSWYICPGVQKTPRPQIEKLDRDTLPHSVTISV